ncbi:MAG: nucleoside monophosphate kinase [Candidatus Pacebacteria bacterium]|nr:nucleoside monophosphate kinase [Candidatus Paceibacterota bacterium]
MEKSPLVIILLGKSGSGKGTQVNLLKERYGLDFLGTGALLRERKKIEDFSGKKISEVIDNGGIVPPPVVFKLWMEKFDQFKNRDDFKGIILDGSPRKLREAYLMEDALAWFEWDKNIKVMLIDISDEEALKRIGKRKICSKCGDIIIVPAGEDIAVCSKCGGEMIVRPEDSVEGTKKRLEWFKDDVGETVKFYEDQNMLIRINGEQSVEDVFKDIVKEIEG